MNPNYHVIDGATSAKALFADDTSLPVTGILAKDSKRDIAILKIQPPKVKKLAKLTLRQTHPKKGQPVIAFGSPQGLDFSVTQGMVSAIRTSDEKIVIDMALEGAWIQTDAAISKGNSGGPLVDLSGRVVGMNTFGNLMGNNLNFAISASDIASVFEYAKDTKPTLLKESLSSPEMPAVRFLGTWESPSTSDVFSIGQHPRGLTLEVVSSPTLKQGKGSFYLSDDRKSWTGVFSAVFVGDKSQRQRENRIELVAINSDKLKMTGYWIKWDRAGREVSSERAETVLVRKKK